MFHLIVFVDSFLCIYYPLKNIYFALYKMVAFPLLYNTFLVTTDPLCPYSRLFSLDVALSIAINLFLYVLGYLFIVFLFKLPDRKILILQTLIVIMSLGYVSRLARTKGIYKVLSEKMDKHAAREESMSVIRNGYFTWYFLS